MNDFEANKDNIFNEKAFRFRGILLGIGSTTLGYAFALSDHLVVSSLLFGYGIPTLVYNELKFLRLDNNNPSPEIIE